MKNRPVTLMIVTLAALVAAGTTQAQSAPSPSRSTSPYGSWAVVLGAATDNRSKDASKSNGQGYAYGTATWTSPDGHFYAAPGFEGIDSSTGSQLELQAYLGTKQKVAGTDIDLRAAYKYQTDADPGTDDEAWEFTGNFTHALGPTKARLQLQYSPDGTGGVRAWTWVEGRIGYDLTPKLNATVAVGRRQQDNAPDYTGANAGLTYAATKAISLDLRYYATDANGISEQYADGFVAGVNVTF